MMPVSRSNVCLKQEICQHHTSKTTKFIDFWGGFSTQEEISVRVILIRADKLMPDSCQYRQIRCFVHFKGLSKVWVKKKKSGFSQKHQKIKLLMSSVFEKSFIDDRLPRQP